MITVTLTDITADELAKIANALSTNQAAFRALETYGVEIEPSLAKFPITTQPDDISEEDNAMLDNLAELDAAGLPWDAELHASTKTKTSNGLWKKRKTFSNSQEAVDVPPPPVFTQTAVPPPPSGLTYPDVIARIMTGITAKKFDIGVVNQHLQSYSIANISVLEHRPDVFADLLAKLGV